MHPAVAMRCTVRASLDGRCTAARSDKPAWSAPARTACLRGWRSAALRV